MQEKCACSYSVGHALKGVRSSLFRLKGDETDSLGATSFAILWQVNIGDSAILLKRVSDIILAEIPGQVAYIVDENLLSYQRSTTYQGKVLSWVQPL